MYEFDSGVDFHAYPLFPLHVCVCVCVCVCMCACASIRDTQMSESIFMKCIMRVRSEYFYHYYHDSDYVCHTYIHTYTHNAVCNLYIDMMYIS